ncbi:MAG TPA: GTP-binding protein, partial [Ilumatobacteraceae bacterium]|nr:GTP-binding protein [Ilumatobacteraceae bacterium]
MPTPRAPGANTAIRNVAVVGHSSSGKTTLVEALLHRSGVLTRAGSVDDGTTVTDHEPEEHKRRISLSLGIAPLDWKADDGNTYSITLLDTPGYPDFSGEIDAALAVADLAVVVVSAVDGVQVGTERAWRRCVAAGVPRLVFVTKEDKEHADFGRVLDQLRASFGGSFVPLELPLGEAGELHGVADVLSDVAFEYEADGTHHTETLPADVADAEHALHDAVVEEIVAGDDVQLERYLSGETMSPEELEHVLAAEMLAGT